MLLIATLRPLVEVDWSNRRLRRVLALIAVYEAILLGPVLANATRPGILEWGHRLVLLGGSVVVGSWLVTYGLHRRALRLFYVGSGFVAGAAVVDCVRRSFAAPYPFGLHKNFVGNIVGSALLLLLIAPDETGTEVRWRRPLTWVLVAGLAASQSRGSILAVAVGLILWGLASRDRRRRRLIVVAGVVPLLAFVLLSLRAEVSQGSTEFSSIGSRQVFETQALDVFRSAPIFGRGIRFYFTGSFALQSNPHQLILETLAESGIVGLVALLILMGGTLHTLRQRRVALSLAASTIIVARIAHGLVDIFWVAGVQSFPWMVVGMAVTGPVTSRHRRAIRAQKTPT
jgi:O-antigen ligase